jgi:hypothetical protein
MIMGFGFGKALDILRDGDAVRRTAWNPGVFDGKTFLIAVPASEVTVDAGRPLGKAMPSLVGAELFYGAHIDRVTVMGEHVVFVESWAPTHDDLLAEDWMSWPKPEAPVRARTAEDVIGWVRIAIDAEFPANSGLHQSRAAALAILHAYEQAEEADPSRIWGELDLLYTPPRKFPRPPEGWRGGAVSPS